MTNFYKKGYIEVFDGQEDESIHFYRGLLQGAGSMAFSVGDRAGEQFLFDMETILLIELHTSTVCPCLVTTKGDLKC